MRYRTVHLQKQYFIIRYLSLKIYVHASRIILAVDENKSVTSGNFSGNNVHGSEVLSNVKITLVSNKTAFYTLTVTRCE